MPSQLSVPRFLPSYQILPMQFICWDGVQGSNLVRPATAPTTDIPFAVSQVGYDVAPNLIAAITNGTATYTPVAAQPGEELQCFTLGDNAPVVLGAGGATPGALIGFNSVGAAVMVAIGSGMWYGGIASETGAAGEIISILVAFGKA